MIDMTSWLPNSTDVITGVISAFIFIFLVFYIFRPWFLIGGHICQTNEGFKFKMINITLFKCTEFQIFLRQVVVHDLEKGTDLNFEMLDLKRNPFIYVPSILSGFKESRPNCIQFKTEKDVKKVIEEHGTYIELILIARHGLSGIQSIRKKKYKHVDCIEKGKFKRGFDFRITKKPT